MAVLDRLGFGRLNLDREDHRSRFWSWVCWPFWVLKNMFVLGTLPRGSIVVFQVPSKIRDRRSHPFVRTVKRFRRLRFVGLFHDFDEIQHKDRAAGPLLGETQALVDLLDKWVVHNARMKAWLQSKGVPAEKMVTLELFDYLSGFVPQKRPRRFDPIVLAGRLDAMKSAYVKGLRELEGLSFNLYGLREPTADWVAERVRACGVFSPDELPAKLEGGWGLVWDGDSMDTCSGPTGNYLRYNNPHKASLYLCAGLPLIVWRQSALSELVEREGLGLIVDSLRDVKSRIDALTDEAYDALVDRVREFSVRVRTGAFTERAFREVIDG